VQSVTAGVAVGTVQFDSKSTGKQISQKGLLVKERHCSLCCFRALGDNEGGRRIAHLKFQNFAGS
jgi:hypothetical protein